MVQQVQDQINRLTAILRNNGFESPLAEAASSEELAWVEAETGIRLDDDFRALYSLCNGSNACTCLAVMTDELTPCALASLDDCVNWWREWQPYDRSVHAKFGPGPGEPGRDRRILPDFYVNQHWLPFAEFNCWSTAVYFDTAPTSFGNYGQIIVYQHDPDAVYFVARSTSEFLIASNDLLEVHLAELLFVDGHPSTDAPRRLV